MKREPADDLTDREKEILIRLSLAGISLEEWFDQSITKCGKCGLWGRTGGRCIAHYHLGVWERAYFAVARREAQA